MYLCLSICILLCSLNLTEACVRKTIVLYSERYKELAESISTKLGYTLGDITLNSFSDGEVRLLIKDDLKLSNVVIVHSTRPKPNRSLIELLFMISTVKREGALYVTLVLPYLCYSRQHVSLLKGEPNSSEIIANLFQSLKVDRLITLDTHSKSLENYYTQTKFETHLVSSVVAKHFADLNLHNVVIVAPDEGAKRRAYDFLEQYNKLLPTEEPSEPVFAMVHKYRVSSTNMAMLCKYRSPTSGVQSTYLSGSSVKDKTAIIVDDMIDTGMTTIKASQVLKTYGAKDIYAFATHGVLSGDAVQNIERSEIKKVFITNTIQQPQNVVDCDKIKIVDVSEFLVNLLKPPSEDNNLRT